MLAGTLFASRSLSPAARENDLAVGFAFALFLFGVLQFARGESSPLYASVAHHLAGFLTACTCCIFHFFFFCDACGFPRNVGSLRPRICYLQVWWARYACFLPG